MKITETKVLNMDGAIHGMRNPMNSWDQSDSKYENGAFVVGEKDNELAKKLIKAGTDHRKFLRQIFISVFIEVPRYIWTELDTYKVATVRNSCSTIHKLGSRNLTPCDFQDNLVMEEVLDRLNFLGEIYRKNKNVAILREMKQILPEGFLQGATYTMNYENAMNMYHSRKNHRMSEWSGPEGICEWIETLPMMSEWLKIKNKSK